MSFDEQPYDKNDHDLHDACEEIKRLRALVERRGKVIEKMRALILKAQYRLEEGPASIEMTDAQIFLQEAVMLKDDKEAV